MYTRAVGDCTAVVMRGPRVYLTLGCSMMALLFV